MFALCLTQFEFLWWTWCGMLRTNTAMDIDSVKFFLGVETVAPLLDIERQHWWWGEWFHALQILVGLQQ